MTDVYGTVYYEVDDDGNGPLIFRFDNISANITIEFDIMVNDISGAGSIAGAVPYSSELKGRGAGLRNNGSGTRWEPSSTVTDTVFDITDRKYTEISVYKDKWTHVTMTCDGENLKITYSSCDDGTVYVDKQLLALGHGVGTALYPINRISFGLCYFEESSSSAMMCIKNFRYY